MMGTGYSKKSTGPIRPNSSDPLEIARRHREGPPDPETVPDRIGPYKIHSKLNEGGMGVVYLAEQGSPDRKVAIKIIHPHRRTKEILARFDIEREALAIMDHPNIAQVFGAGESADGRPYFVMEYIHGIPITEYCDMNKLTTNERLGLFRDVCRAVHHAHQKGIIHRDIKPGNVLVSVQGDHPTPKVIDFGVAKAVGHQLTQRTVFTEQGQLIGTPGYMSPEQAEMSPLDIDTRTDVYSLGVLLYELLVGAQPFDVHKLLERGFGEIQRVIREVDPQKPSTRLSSMGDDSTLVASNRHTVVRSLSRELRGDLDWITMRCLEKDRTRRYRSADALADDIERHLRAEPVFAGPPSAIYKVRKFVRRHRIGVTAGSAIAAAIVAGFVGTAVQYVRADRERARADIEAVTATKVKNFMIDLFKVSDPGEARGNSITAREILERGATQLTGQLEDQPAVRAALTQTISDVYTNLGLFSQARDFATKALEIRRHSAQRDPSADSESLCKLATILDFQSEYDAAEKMHREALRIRREAFREPHAAIADSLAGLGFTLHKRGKIAEAKRCYEEALAMRRAIYGGAHESFAGSLSNIAALEFSAGNYDHADALFREVLEIQTKQYGRRHPEAGKTVFLIGQTEYARGHLVKSELRFRDALEIFKTVYAPDHPQLGACLSSLATALARQQKYGEAEPLAAMALEISTKALGAENEQVALDLMNLGTIRCRLGDCEKGLDLQRRSLPIWLKHNASQELMAGVCRLRLGQSLTVVGRFLEAEVELMEAYRIFERKLGDQDGRTKECIQALMDLYTLQDLADQALAYRDMPSLPMPGEKQSPTIQVASVPIAAKK